MQVRAVSAPTRTRHHYGPHNAQVADLWRPGRRWPGAPVVVLVHGGFWKAPFTKRYMNGLAASLAGRGTAAWNVEYRRLGLGGGWPATFDDVVSALGHLRELDGLDLGRVVTCGHSAGGHLALWLASSASSAGTGVAVRGAVSLAGVSDLARAVQLGLGHGAAYRLLGGTPAEVPERFGACSPLEMLPLGRPQVLLHGLADTVVPASMSEYYCRRACAAGDHATYVPLAGVGHRDFIDPASPAWAAALEHIERLLA